jgi:hypothetical protein
MEVSERREKSVIYKREKTKDREKLEVKREK